jgi:hypothetical protein
MDQMAEDACQLRFAGQLAQLFDFMALGRKNDVVYRKLHCTKV